MIYYRELEWGPGTITGVTAGGGLTRGRYQRHRHPRRGRRPGDHRRCEPGEHRRRRRRRGKAGRAPAAAAERAGARHGRERAAGRPVSGSGGGGDITSITAVSRPHQQRGTSNDVTLSVGVGTRLGVDANSVFISNRRRHQGQACRQRRRRRAGARHENRSGLFWKTVSGSGGGDITSVTARIASRAVAALAT